jgi:hypothetical protein
VKPLLVYPYGGLGNQIRTVASAIYWARQLEVPLVILYNPHESQVVQALRTLEHWELCFDLKALPFTLLELGPERTVVDTRFPLQGDLAGLDAPDLVARSVDRGLVLKADSYIGGYRHRCPNPLGFLVPSCRTLGYVDSFFKSAAQRFGTTKFKGIHLRYAQTPSFAYSPLELFVERLKAEPGPFVLVCDLVKVRDNFLKKFARSDVAYPVWDTLEQKSAEDVWRSWVDMLLLARCSLIYGSYFSSFDEVASYLGNVHMIKLVRGKASR